MHREQQRKLPTTSCRRQWGSDLSKYLWANPLGKRAEIEVALAWGDGANDRAANTITGGWRAKNVNQQSYAVKYWCEGNEMFGPWQLGFMQMQHYTLKNNLVVEAMRKADPTVVLTAVGDLSTINKEHDPDQAKSGKTCSHI